MKIAVTVKLSDFQALMRRATRRVTEAAGRAVRMQRPVRARRIRESRR